MISIKDRIKKLREKKQRLEAIKLVQENQINSNYVSRYYYDTLHGNHTTGKVVIITPEQCCVEDAPNGITHKKAAQKILNNIKKHKVDIDSLSERDFGFSLSEDENYIVIRMVPLMIGYSTICLPESVNSFQLEKLKEFNSFVEIFNEYSKYPVEFRISYSNPEAEFSDLNLEISNLESHLNNSIFTDDLIVYDAGVSKIK